MGFLDFLKKKQDQVKKEVVSQYKLQEWLDGRKTKIEEQEQDFFVVVKEKISQFISELEKRITIIKIFDVDAKKVDERIKILVKGNVKTYLEYLQKLITSLKEIDNGKNIVEKINSIFSRFEKNSKMSYEKATILVGKEMKDAKNCARNFLRELEKIIKKHQLFITEAKILVSLETYIVKFKELKELKLGVEEEVNTENKKIKELKERIKENEKRVEALKNSEEFLKENEKRRGIERKKQILEESLNELKNLINFKTLTNFYHIFEKEMNLVKEYRENFKECFHKAEGEDFIVLLKAAGMQTEEISQKITKIQNLKKEIREIKIEETEAESLEKIIEKRKAEIRVLEDELVVKKKRLEKLEESVKEVLGAVTLELKKVDIEID